MTQMCNRENGVEHLSLLLMVVARYGQESRAEENVPIPGQIVDTRGLRRKDSTYAVKKEASS
jgi:hypothetical protein